MKCLNFVLWFFRFFWDLNCAKLDVFVLNAEAYFSKHQNIETKCYVCSWHIVRESRRLSPLCALWKAERDRNHQAFLSPPPLLFSPSTLLFPQLNRKSTGPERHNGWRASLIPYQTLRLNRLAGWVPFAPGNLNKPSVKYPYYSGGERRSAFPPRDCSSHPSIHPSIRCLVSAAPNILSKPPNALCKGEKPMRDAHYGVERERER